MGARKAECSPRSVRRSCEHTFVKAKTIARLEARRLRVELGWSLARIARELDVAKSSVSVWIRDAPHRSAMPALMTRADTLSVRRLPVWRSGRVRRCGRCGHDLPRECFNRFGTGRQWWCRRCFAAYFRERGELHRIQSRAAKQARRRRIAAFVLLYLRTHPCVDCGKADPVVLDFDHVGEKTAGIAELVTATATLDAIESEITRCDVVCANCHRRRTARRAGWRRLSCTGRPYASTALERNFDHLHAILARTPCVDCGERDPVVLEFDHVGPKRANVTRLAWSGSSLATLDAEIARCAVRCANCHRRTTAQRGGHFRFRALTSPRPP